MPAPVSVDAFNLIKPLSVKIQRNPLPDSIYQPSFNQQSLEIPCKKSSFIFSMVVLANFKYHSACWV